MLRSLKEVKGYKIRALDGELGSVRDLLFDDELWTIRYMVAATGPWLLGKRVLLGWPALETPDWTSRLFPVNLTTEQVKESPSIDADAPVSRRREQELYVHYGWTPYWPAAPIAPAINEQIFTG